MNSNPFNREIAIQRTRAAFEHPAALSALSKRVFDLRANGFNALSIAQQITDSCERLPQFGIGLEPGCGMGAKSNLFYQIVRAVDQNLQSRVGIDLAAPAIEVARTKNPEVEYMVGDFERSPQIRARQYSYIFLGAMLHHVYDLRETMETISSLLSQDGIAIILDTFPPDNKILYPFSKLLHKMYCSIEGRREAFYNWVTLSEMTEILETTPHLALRSNERAKGRVSWYGFMNTQCIIVQKEG